jgi:glycosyltransferase involved in cell wall biosynthesis
MVECFSRLGFESVFVERPNSNSRYHAGRGAPKLNSRIFRMEPPQTQFVLEDGRGVLCVPKKIGIGPLRVFVGRRRQERLQARWLEKFFARLGARSGKRHLAIVACARWEPLLRNIPFDLLVFDKTDPPESLRGWLPEREYLERERALIERSTLVLSPSETLLSSVRSHHPDVRMFVVPNGVDSRYFEAHRGDPVPELEDARRPVAGFLGSIAPWVDISLLVACAKAYPSWTFPIVGPLDNRVDPSPLLGLPNVKFWGEVPYHRVPAIMEAFDVALMPFVPGPVSDAANPVTLYEFLYLGKPVVLSPMSQLERFSPLLYMSRENFIANLRLAAEERDQVLREKRRQVGLRHGWDGLVEEMLVELRLTDPIAVTRP